MITDSLDSSGTELASYFNEPVCKVREYFYRFYTLGETCQSTTQKVMQIASLIFGMAMYALLTPLTAPIAAALRALVATFASKPFIYLERSKIGKILPEDKQITLISHNQCYMPAGYSITDGQVTPDTERMDANIEEMKRLNPDVICLYEVADICDANYISAKLPEYPFIIPVAGMRAIGPSSMMYIASKYEIDSIEFVPFIKGEELTGRAQFSEKGFLTFDIKSQGDAFASVISTHLQHSEIPQDPEESEQISRARQMDRIIGQIQKKMAQDKNVIFTGDLNQSEDELDAYLQGRQIDWLKRDESIRAMPTWGGDEWCAKLMGKQPSSPQVLDYTFIAGKASSIQTQIIKTGYCSSQFIPQALSDHDLLFSTISVD